MATFDLSEDLQAPDLNAAVGVLAYKDVDQSVTNSTVLVADESILWDLAATAVYGLNAWIVYLSEDTPDIKFGWSLPAGASMLWHGTGYSIASAFQAFGNSDPSGGASSFGGSGSGAARVARMTGTVLMGDTDGSLNLQWAQFVANAATTSVLAGSFGVLRRIT